VIGFVIFVVILVGIVWGAALATRKDRNLKDPYGKDSGWSYGLGYQPPGDRDRDGLKRIRRRRRG
jgi:hypothetical protein